MNILHKPMLAMVVYYPVLCVGGGTVLRLLKKREKHAASVRSATRGKSVELTIELSLAATLVLWTSNLLIRPGWIEPETVAHGLRVCGMHRETFWLTGWMVVLINPIFEEYLWRLGILSFLTGFRTEKEAIVISSIVFAGYHPIVVAGFFPAPWLAAAFLIVFAGGAALAYLFLRTRNIVYSIVFHMVINLNLMLMGYLYAPWR